MRTSQSSLSVCHLSSSLCLLDFLHVLALGNEQLGEVVSLVVLADYEGAVKKFQRRFREKIRTKGQFFVIDSVAENVSAK